MKIKKVCFLVFYIFLVFTGCKSNINDEKRVDQITWNNLEYESSMDLVYAKNFSVDYYKGGYALININELEKFLIIPEDKQVPIELDKDITVIKQPINNIYLVATSAMDLFRSLDEINSITLCGTDIDNWYIPQAKDALKSGTMVYAGKYNMPDYELILNKGCNLAIESTMIYHTPKVKEKFEELGIPVLVEYSSYEPHPLGRMEWIKLYSVLFNKEELAKNLVVQQEKLINSIVIDNDKPRTVAFFYISNSGYVNVRKSEDYISKMIEIAGGKYIFDNIGNEENALSTINMQIESFYDKAKDADILIYNSTIDGELETIDDLLKKSQLLKDFKAVQWGNVWCTSKNMFQETMSIGDMILDFNTVMYFNENEKQLKYLYRLK